MGGQRLFVLGIDGLSPYAFDRFRAMGVLPNCERLLQSATRFEVIPTLPPLTAPGWSVIASGAHPATIGVNNILQPVPGKPPNTICNGFARSLTSVEYIWDTLSDVGRRAIVLKYPGSWPPRDGSFLQIDGAGGYADITCEFEAVPSAVYHCERIPIPPRCSEETGVPIGYSANWRIDSGGDAGVIPIVGRAPLNWQALPSEVAPAFEFILPVDIRGERRRLTLFGIAYRVNGRERVRISNSRTFSDVLADVAHGEWSVWIEGTARRGRYAFRLKLLDLELEAGRARIYRSSGHLESGFSKPTPLASELYAEIGPVVEWTGTYDFMNGLIDLQTQLEIYEAHTTWMESAIRSLDQRGWDAFFTHWHVVEYAHHIAGACLDDAHQLSNADRQRYDSFLSRSYSLMDRLVGTVLEHLTPDDGLALVSDHGHDLVHSLFFINDYLNDCGLLHVFQDENGVQIDWTKSKAYALFPGCVIINRRSRWPGGIIADEEVMDVCLEVEAALRRVLDPNSNRAIVTHVIGPSDLAQFGQGGIACPDLFFCLNRGYEVATRIRHIHTSVFAATIPGRTLTSGHGSFFPHSDSARTLAILRHPSLAGGLRCRDSVALIDLAPTFAKMLGIRPPKHADGTSLNFDSLQVANSKQIV